MNAARRFASHLPREAIVRLLARRPGRFEDPWPADAELDRAADTAELAARLARRYEADLPGLLNALGDDDLRAVARGERVVDGEGPRVDLRMALWRRGAAIEAGTDAHIGIALQPAPVAIAGRLVHLARPRGTYPPALGWP